MQKLIRWERDFTRSMLRLAVPIMLQSMIVAMMHIVDNLMIGYLGETALAGVTQANRISFLFQLAMFGMVGGASVLASQYWGNKDVKNIRRVLGMGMIIAIALAAVFALPSMIMPERVMALLIRDEEARVAGAQYLRIVSIAYFMQGLSLLYSSILKSTERAVLPMIAASTAIVLNTALNYVLIYGRFGFPAWGVRGAAIATVIGCAVELAILVTLSYKRKYATAARLAELRIPDAAFAKRFMRVVIPVLANEAFWSLGVVMYSIAYGRMGNSGSVVAAVGVYNNIEQLASVATRGVMHSSAVMIGMCVGVGDKDRSMLYAKRFLLGSVVVGMLAGALVLIVRNPALSIYRGRIPDSTLQIARTLITYYAISLFIKAGCGQVIVGVLRPGGDVMFSMFLDTVPLWIIGVPLVWICGVALQWPIEYVYPLTFVEEIVKLAIGIHRIKSRKWIHNLVRS